MNEVKIICSKCSREVDKNSVCIIDEKSVCFTCMYGDARPFEIYPIGKVTTDLNPHETGAFPAASRDISRIDLVPSQKQFMYKLEEEKFLLIVYYLHEVKTLKTVFHRRLDGKEAGIFASRTPNRLSKIGVQDVKLLKIEGAKLYVEGLDAIEGSPVLDIKLGLSHRKEKGRL